MLLFLLSMLGAFACFALVLALAGACIASVSAFIDWLMYI